MRTWLTGFFFGFTFAMASAALANDPTPEGALQSSAQTESVPSLPDDQGVESRGLAKVRTLLPDEIALAKSVFQNTLNYSMVRVTDTLGLGGKPWTTNSPPLYLLNVGGDYPNLAAADDRRRLLIHELTHVWQAQHLVPITLNSAAHQTLSAIQNGGDVSAAYAYTVGKSWGSTTSNSKPASWRTGLCPRISVSSTGALVAAE